MKLRTLIDVCDRYLSVAITGVEDGMINVGWNFRTHKWEVGSMCIDRLLRVEQLKNNKDYKNILMNCGLITFSTINASNFPSLAKEDPNFKPFNNNILLVKIYKIPEQKKKFSGFTNRKRKFRSN